MPVVFSTGFEFKSQVAAYQNSGWIASGTVDTHDTAQAFQHSRGYGGGEASLSCAASAYIKSPTTLFEAVNTGTLSTGFYATGSFTAGRKLCEVLQTTSADPIVSIHAVDNGSTTRLALLHAGVTFAQTSALVQQNRWTRLAASWNVVGATISGQLYIDQRTTNASGSTALTTGVTAAGLGWGTATNSTTYHDQVVVWDEDSPAAREQFWIQGIIPNADNVNGLWGPNPATANFYERIQDPTDGTFLETINATYGQWDLQNRIDINPGFSDFNVLACTTWVEGQGDGTLQDGRAHMVLGASTIAGLTLSMSTSSSLAFVFSTTKPGGGAWLETDIDNLGVGYSVA